MGGGTGFGADLFALYRAGRVDLPALAMQFGEWTSCVHDASQRVSFLSDSVGGEYALSIAEEIRGELHHALRHTAVSMDEVGQALVQIAADYAATDRAASDEFNRLLGQQQRMFVAPTPSVPVPPASDDPYDERYLGPSLEAPQPEPWWLTERLREVADGARDGLGDLVDHLGEAVDEMTGDPDEASAEAGSDDGRAPS